MIPVVGLDVAKGATEAQIFLDKGQPYGPHFGGMGLIGCLRTQGELGL